MPANTQIPELIDHLFRVESGKLVAVLTGIFGAHHLELAEDTVQDTLMDALSIWNYKGIPQNPCAWLYTVARNKALNIIRREKSHKKFTTEAAYLLQSEWAYAPALERLFSDKEVADGQLRMMFICCHPSISPDSQIALILKTLCGFSIPEIARAFLSTEDSVGKRLVRAPAHGGYITGKNIYLKKDAMIVQTWRGKDWSKKEPDSIFIIELEPKEKDTILYAIHANIPDKHADGIDKGWHSHYWEPWKKYLAGKPISKSAEM